MSTTSFIASHKKELGTIEIVGDGKIFLWKPSSSGSNKPPVRFSLDTVAQLQATPPTSDKLQLKIVCTISESQQGTTGNGNTPTGSSTATPSGNNETTQSYQFAFKDRAVMDNAKASLQKLVQAIRADASRTGTPGGSATPSTGTAGNSINRNGSSSVGGGSGLESRQAIVDLDSKKLLINLNLQQALLRENKDLMRTFQETVIQGGLANDKFWNTRIHLLRAYALTSSQKRGAYNVLGTIRPTTGSDNQINVSLTREKIHDIFEQYPIVRQAYSDNVPSKMSEGSFWERFFLSRLFRRLRGEKVPTTHIIDQILDTKYLTLYEDEQEDYNSRILGGAERIGGPNDRKRKMGDKRSDGISIVPSSSSNKDDNDTTIKIDSDNDNDKDDEDDDDDIYHKIVPQYLDIGGNEENDPQKLGNLPDITMQPGRSDASAISLIRSMNSLSQRMLYGNSTTPRIITGNEKADKNEADALQEELRFEDLEGNSVRDTDLELHLVDGNAIDGSSNNQKNINDDDYEVIKQIRIQFSNSLQGDELNLSHVGQNSLDIEEAVKQVSTVSRLRSKETDQLGKIWSESEQDKRLLDQVQLCHATSIEFLRHFWLNFLSGDPNQASAIAKLVISLNKSLERIEAVAKAAATPEGQTRARNSLAPLEISIKTALDQYDTAVKQSEKESTPIIV